MPHFYTMVILWLRIARITLLLILKKRLLWTVDASDGNMAEGSTFGLVL